MGQEQFQEDEQADGKDAEEKGAQTDVIVSTEGNFDPAKLSFEIWNIDGDPVIASISYAGNELEILADSSTGKAFYAYLGSLE